MHTAILAALVALAPRPRATADSQWVLVQSTITYHISHPLHQVDGVSHAARGKGACHAGQCDFLIAVPVKSFDSGDSNGDLHMLQVTRGAEFPMVSVRTELPETAEAADTIRADIEINLRVRLPSINRFIVPSRTARTSRSPARFPRRSRPSRSNDRHCSRSR